jgi:protein-disulfide isomerase
VNDSESAPAEQPLPDRPSWLNEIQTHPDKKALGDLDAPVTITEYLDFECPFCQRYNQNTFPKILKNYIQSGQIYYRVRHFPLPMHENAVPAANAAECAVDQGKFWAFKSVVMNSDRSLSNQMYFDVVQHIDIGDIKKFKNCVRSMNYRDVVNQAKSDGAKKGVSATPTIFIEDTKIEGSKPYQRFNEAINQYL